MRKSKMFSYGKTMIWMFFFFLSLSPLHAQDKVPVPAQPDEPLLMPGQTREMHRAMRRLPLANPMPSDFFHSADNVIEDPSHSLVPFLKKMNDMSEPVRIVHIGDSHVRGHVFPFTTRRALEASFGAEGVHSDTVTYRTSGLARETGEPGIVYNILGVNGATNVTFSTEEKMDQIAALHPDLIIVSFGTNEAHSQRYLPQVHEMQIDRLLSMLKKACPEAMFLLTTPPGAYVSRRRVRTVNPRSITVARVIKDYSREHNLAVWDMYNVVGGKTDACRNWTKHRMIRPDGIHFTVEGYRLQGNLLYQALIKAYNEYVGTGVE